LKSLKKPRRKLGDYWREIQREGAVKQTVDEDKSEFQDRWSKIKKVLLKVKIEKNLSTGWDIQTEQR